MNVGSVSSGLWSLAGWGGTEVPPAARGESEMSPAWTLNANLRTVSGLRYSLPVCAVTQGMGIPLCVHYLILLLNNSDIKYVPSPTLGNKTLTIMLTWIPAISFRSLLHVLKRGCVVFIILHVSFCNLLS